MPSNSYAASNANPPRIETVPVLSIVTLGMLRSRSFSLALNALPVTVRICAPVTV